MLKHHFVRIYNALTRPIYVRIKHDIKLDFQQLIAAQQEEQEKYAAKILDELIATRLELEKAINPGRTDEVVSSEISDDEISEIVNQMTSHMRIVELACEHGYPVKDLVAWREKYGGMSPKLIRRIRKLEAENFRLKQALALQSLEKSVESDANLFS